MTAILKTGDPVAITYDDALSIYGTVKLASPNGRSLMLEFEAILGGYVGMMPVLQDDDGTYRDLIHRRPVAIVKRIGRA